jgi:hypothetical protein
MRRIRPSATAISGNVREEQSSLSVACLGMQASSKKRSS